VILFAAVVFKLVVFMLGFLVVVERLLFLLAPLEVAVIIFASSVAACEKKLYNKLILAHIVLQGLEMNASIFVGRDMQKLTNYIFSYFLHV
jgi:hypothetical protein